MELAELEKQSKAESAALERKQQRELKDIMRQSDQENAKLSEEVEQAAEEAK